MVFMTAFIRGFAKSSTKLLSILISLNGSGRAGGVRQVEGRAHRRGRAAQSGAARRRHRGLPPLREGARLGCPRDRARARDPRHRAAGGSSARRERLHRRIGQRRPVRRRRGGEPARRQPRGAERDCRGAACDPGHPPCGRCRRGGAMSDVKTAAYLCAGCGLGEGFDLGQLEKIAKGEGKMALVRQHEMLCRDDGVRLIRDDIANEGVTHVMLGACSRRAKTDAFAFDEVAMARSNLREGVLWVVAEGDAHAEVRQEMADDYVRMGCAELKKRSEEHTSELQSPLNLVCRLLLEKK